jgi:cytidylate kinase
MRKNSADIFWRYLSAQSLLTPERPIIPKPAITISRQTGAGALTVANLVAEKLDATCQGDPPCPWSVFDRNLAARILEDHSLSAKIEQFMPEDAKLPLTETLEVLLGLHPTSWILKEDAKETIRKLAEKGNVILVGRGGAAITSPLPHILHIRLVAPFSFRVRHFADFHQITAEKATKQVRETDEARHHYVQRFFGADVDDPLQYHLVINTGRTGFAAAAQIIAEALVEQMMRERQQRETVHSR